MSSFPLHLAILGSVAIPLYVYLTVSDWMRLGTDVECEVCNKLYKYNYKRVCSNECNTELFLQACKRWNDMEIKSKL